MSNGLGSLSDPGLVRQIGFIVSKVINDHEDFRAIVSRCDPAQRPAMYEALKPYIRFELKPLDFYMARSGELAEAKQLDTQDADGNLKPFRVPEITTQPAEQPATNLEVAQKVMDEAFAQAHLKVVCKRCTREETFHGLRREDAVGYARLAGWKRVVSMLGDVQPVEICPACAQRT